MFRIFTILVMLLALSQPSFAAKMQLSVQAKNIFIGGTFPFSPGKPIRITASDSIGKPYKIEVHTQVQNDDKLKIVCKLDHLKTKKSVSVITQKGHGGVVASSTNPNDPELKLTANWID